MEDPYLQGLSTFSPLSRSSTYLLSEADNFHQSINKAKKAVGSRVRAPPSLIVISDYDHRFCEQGFMACPMKS
jgi:hypothetical protein